MLRNMLISKIHRATVTKCELHYIGSITIDKDILDKADILENEEVEVYDFNNGNRFQTYVIGDRSGSREFVINGPAARLVHPGDKIIVLNYALMEQEKAKNYQPKIVILDDENEVLEVK